MTNRKFRCPMCACTAKRKTGECDRCGIFVCKTCKGMHLGEVRPCPGKGIPTPKGDSR